MENKPIDLGATVLAFIAITCAIVGVSMLIDVDPYKVLTVVFGWFVFAGMLKTSGKP